MSSTNGSDKAHLTIELLAKAKKLDADYLIRLHLEDIPGGGVSIPYYADAPGDEVLFRRERDNPRRKNSEGEPKRFHQPAGVKLQPYGLWRLIYARETRFLYLVEGESDCWTLWHYNLPALGIQETHRRAASWRKPWRVSTRSTFGKRRIRADRSSSRRWRNGLQS